MRLGRPTAKPILPLGDPNDTPETMRVTSPYGIRNGVLHAAIDVGNYIAGDTLTAVGNATVVDAGYLSLPWSTPKPADSWWYAQPEGQHAGQRGGLYGPPSRWSGPVWGGQQIILDLGNNVFAAYAHCDGVSVKAGDRVTFGQSIGAVGSTGSAYRQPHLHFGLRIRGVWVDPWPYIVGTQLLPDTALPPEEDDVKLKGRFVSHVHNRRTSTTVDAHFRAGVLEGDDQSLKVFPAGTAFIPVVAVTGRSVGGSDTWLGGWLYIDTWTFGYFHDSVLAEGAPIELSGYTADDIEKAKADGLRAGQADMKTRATVAVQGLRIA